MLDIIAHIWSHNWPTLLTGNVMIVLILAVFSALLVYETLQPRDVYSSKKLHQSYKTNIGMFVVNAIALSALSASSLLLMIDPGARYGLFNFITNNNIKIIVSFLSLDWLLYYWHKVCHKYDWLWMFHRVHHNDININVSTAFRVHFIELFLTNVLKVGFVIFTGINGFVLLVHELITTLFVMFHHTNINLKYEAVFSKVFVSPFLHKIHHSVHRNEHDMNYGAIFSFWDRIFGTLLNVRTGLVNTGIKGYSPQDLKGLIQFGFTSPVVITYTPPAPIEEMIQVAAYYKAEKRGFIHGDDQRDWYEAQREITNMVYSISKKRKIVTESKWFKFDESTISFC